MAKHVKFISITRAIDKYNGKHYLDAIDENGTHWFAEMSSTEEPWLVYTKVWTKDPQQPRDI